MDLCHTISMRRRQPQQNEHAWSKSEEIRTKIPQSVCVLFRSLGGSDIEIRFPHLLTGLPETDLGKVPQIPRQRPGVGSDHGYPRRLYCIPACELLNLRRQPEQVLRGVSVGVRIGFVGRMHINALSRVVGD